MGEKTVPKNIKNIASLICTRFAIDGICDPMYIANVIGIEARIGNGQGTFFDNEISNAKNIAMRLQGCYGCNITPEEIQELQEIIESESVNNQIAIPGMKKFINRLEEEKLTCDEWRIGYLSRVIKSLKNNILKLQDV